MNETNYDPGLVTFYDIWPGNWVGLFTKENIKEKYIRKENIKGKQVRRSKRKKVIRETNRQTIYIAPEFTNVF